MREDRQAWENYTMNHPDALWYQEGRNYQKEIGTDDLDNRPQLRSDDPNLDLSTGFANYIYDYDYSEGGKATITGDAEFYLPTWQVSQSQTPTV